MPTTARIARTVVASFYAAHLTHLTDLALHEQWLAHEATRLNPTVPDSLRAQARQAASTCWLLAHARQLPWGQA